MNKTFLLALTGLLIVLGVVAARPARAQDRRPCVSKVEFLGTPTRTYTRPVMEARWDVTGLGYIDREFSGPKENMWVYEACDVPDGEVWVFVRKSDHVYTGGFWYDPRDW